MSIVNKIILAIFIFYGMTGFSDLLEDASEDAATPTSDSNKNSKNPSSPNLLQDDNQPKEKGRPVKQKPNEQTTVIKPAPGDNKSTPEKKASDKSDRNKNSDAPIRFESSGLSGERDGGVIVLEKDVLVTQDDLKITADKATIKMDRKTNEVLEVVAVGNVHFKRKDPDTGQLVTSESREAVFNNQTRTVVLKGEPKMMRGSDVVRGKQIIYDLNSGWVKATRVEGVVQPKKNVETKKSTQATEEKHDEVKTQPTQVIPKKGAGNQEGEL